MEIEANSPFFTYNVKKWFALIVGSIILFYCIYFSFYLIIFHFVLFLHRLSKCRYFGLDLICLSKNFYSDFVSVQKMFKLPDYIYPTRWSILFCLILSGWYDKNRVCTKKIEVDLFSWYPEISFGNIESQKITEI